MCQDECHRGGAIEEVSSGTGVAGMSFTNLRVPSRDTFLNPQVEAEEQADIAESFDIDVVPTFLILQVRTPTYSVDSVYLLHSH